jgi:hypothetical protein
MNVMSLFAAVAIGAIGAATACNAERKQECDQLLTAMKPLEAAPAGADAIDRMRSAIATLPLQDQPLHEYASSAKTTLAVLANALKTQASPSPPDGTDDLVKATVKEALAERDDVARYCAQ